MYVQLFFLCSLNTIQYHHMNHIGKKQQYVYRVVDTMWEWYAIVVYMRITVFIDRKFYISLVLVYSKTHMRLMYHRLHYIKLQKHFVQTSSIVTQPRSYIASPYVLDVGYTYTAHNQAHRSRIKRRTSACF